MVQTKYITVCVAYAKPHDQCELTISIPAASTLLEAIEQSGILKRYPEIDLQTQAVGVWNVPKKLTDLLKEGDRVEIYRPLLMDPKELRKKRAEE